MYKFWYDLLKKECKEVNLLYMDTDSFIIEVIDQNFDDVILKNMDKFGTRNFSNDSKLYSTENKKKPGTMKDEYAENRIREHLGIKPKSYSIIAKNNDEKCMHKGHTANFTSDGYRDVLNNNKILTHPLRQITSIDHELFTKMTNKQSLSSFYDKDYYSSSEDRYLPFRYVDISKIKKKKMKNKKKL